MGSYFDIPKAIFYLLKGDYTDKGCRLNSGIEGTTILFISICHLTFLRRDLRNAQRSPTALGYHRDHQWSGHTILSCPERILQNRRSLLTVPRFWLQGLRTFKEVLLDSGDPTIPCTNVYCHRNVQDLRSR